MHSISLLRLCVPAGALLAALIGLGCKDGNELGHLSATRMGDLSQGVPERGRFDAELRAACGKGGLSRSGRAAIKRAPYLQQVTDRSAMVMWTAARGDMSVRITRPDGTLVAERPVAEDTTVKPRSPAQFVAAVSGLEPDTLYCYEVVRGAEILLRPTGFRTAPAADSQDTVRMVLVGDLGTSTLDQYAVRDQMANVPFDLALIPGDLAYEHGAMHELESHFFRVYADLLRTVPFFVASGNHDYATDDAAPFREVFTLPENGGPDGIERWYSFDWGPVHVAVLDTEKITDSQVAWLDADLAASDRPWKLVMAHRPPYSSGHHGSDVPTRQAFQAVFERHQVPLVISGHEHNYERVAPQRGVTYLVTGAGGRGTRPVGTSDFTAHSDRVSHFVYAEITGDVLTLWAIDATGRVFDTTRIERPASSLLAEQ